MQLKLTKRTVDGILAIECSGRIVFGEESADLRDTVKRLLGETKQIVLNLGGVNYLGELLVPTQRSSCLTAARGE